MQLIIFRLYFPILENNNLFMDLERLRKIVNFDYYLSELCEILILNKHKRLYCGAKPYEIYENLSSISRTFKLKYFKTFYDNSMSIFTKDLKFETYDKNINLGKEFIKDFFDNNWQLLKELENENFGNVFIPVETHFEDCDNRENHLSNDASSKILEFFFINESEISAATIIHNEKSDIFKKEKKIRNKQKKIRGVTVEHKTHRIKNNKTKLHYNYVITDIEAHLDDFAQAILKHAIPENEKECKTFKISWKNNSVKIRPGSSYKKKKLTNFDLVESKA